VLQLAGVVNYLGRALTLSGHFAKPGPEGERDDISTPFFVGGAWDAPFVSPAATE
jgi:AsmA protein